MSDPRSSKEFLDNREIVLKKSNFICAMCDSKAEHVHHKDLNKHNHDLNNLLPLCKPCHYQIHRDNPIEKNKRHPDEVAKTGRRTSVTVPVVINDIIFDHMEETGIKTWNAAMFDLVRLGTEYKSVKSSK